ncbi:hypothetical protein HJFPF1_05604 [Paramyrothecium foliicola]|nr:hypothetical protein HJFPF1_05604 [Paramyrothecium foliicola]
MGRIRFQLAVLDGILKHIQSDDEIVGGTKPTNRFRVFEEINHCFETLEKVKCVIDAPYGSLGPGFWALKGKAQVQELSEELNTHINYLELILNTNTGSFVKEMNVNVQDLRSDCNIIKENTNTISAGVKMLIESCKLSANFRGTSTSDYDISIRRYVDGISGNEMGSPPNIMLDAAPAALLPPDSGYLSGNRYQDETLEDLEFPNGITGFLADDAGPDDLMGMPDLKQQPNELLSNSFQKYILDNAPTRTKTASFSTPERTSAQQKTCNNFLAAVQAVANRSQNQARPITVVGHDGAAKASKIEDIRRRFKLQVEKARAMNTQPLSWPVPNGSAAS